MMTGEMWSDSLMLGPALCALQRAKRSDMERELKLQEMSLDSLKGQVSHAEGELLELEKGIARSEAEINLLKNLAHPNLPALEKELEALDSDVRERASLVTSLAQLNLRFERDQTRYTAAFRLKTLAYPAQQYVFPTDLGNVMNATSDYIFDRYGVEMESLWTQMEIVVADDKPLATRIDNEKATLDFMLNLAVIAGLFAVEYLLLHVWLKQFVAAALGAASFIFAGYVVYHVAVGKARSWGNAVQTAFDLHREDLRKRLRLREFRGAADEKAAWTQLGSWILWGKPSPESLFEPTAPLTSIVCSENLRVVVDRVEDAEVRTHAQGDAAAIRWASVISYTILVNNSASGQTPCVADGGSIIVTDARAPRIDRLPEIKNEHQWDAIGISSAILPTGKSEPAHKLLWTIGKMPPASCRVLQYSIFGNTTFSAQVISAEPSPEWLTLEDKDRGKTGYSLALRNLGAEMIVAAEIQVFDRIMDEKHRLAGTLVKPDGSVRIVYPSYDPADAPTKVGTARPGA